MNEVEKEFRKVFGDMMISESEVALRIFEYGYKAGAAAENEACAFIASKEAQQWEYPTHWMPIPAIETKHGIFGSLTNEHTN